MKIIVVGGGKVGTALCRSLVAENHDVILIEKDESVLNHITKRFDIIGILGNGANFKILEQADVEDCDIFISMTEYDEVNMVSAVLALTVLVSSLPFFSVHFYLLSLFSSR